jgi:hypothetical protein
MCRILCWGMSEIRYLLLANKLKTQRGVLLVSWFNPFHITHLINDEISLFS